MKYLAKAFAMIAAVTLVTGSAFAGQLTIETNKTKPVYLSGEAASVVIGNPGIADVSVLDENTLFVTGKTFGTTNLLVFDATGKQIYSVDVVVTTNTSRLVTINRAGQNHTYDCNGACRPTMTVGDDTTFYGAISQQTQAQIAFSNSN